MTVLVQHRDFLVSILDRQAERRRLLSPDETFPAQPSISRWPASALASGSQTTGEGPSSALGGAGKGKSKENVVNYVKAEETIRNDYCEWYGVTGEFGSNFIAGAKDHEICEEYPALKKLMALKAQLVDAHAHPPLYAALSPPAPPPPCSKSRSSLPASILSSLSPSRFDVILINPLASWSATADLPIRQLSADPAIVFLWVGRGDQEGLERGRECFAKWGFRRAEDIVWVKTNRRGTGTGVGKDEGEGAGTGEGAKATGGGTGALFTSQKEHCLMGIRGTVKRSVDFRFAHCNVDTDILVWEDPGDADGPTLPPYLYTLIENFCLGTRRLELFGRAKHARRGWVTANYEPLPSPTDSTSSTSAQPASSLAVQPFSPSTYPNLISEADGRPILPFNPEIDVLRPKSPPRRNQRLPGGGVGGGGGIGSGGGLGLSSGGSKRPSPGRGWQPKPGPGSSTGGNGGSGHSTPGGIRMGGTISHGQMQGQGGLMVQHNQQSQQMGMAGRSFSGVGAGGGGGYPQNVNGGQPGFPSGQQFIPDGMGYGAGMGMGMGMGMPGMQMPGMTGMQGMPGMQMQGQPMAMAGMMGLTPEMMAMGAGMGMPMHPGYMGVPGMQMMQGGGMGDMGMGYGQAGIGIGGLGGMGMGGMGMDGMGMGGMGVGGMGMGGMGGQGQQYYQQQQQQGQGSQNFQMGPRFGFNQQGQGQRYGQR